MTSKKLDDQALLDALHRMEEEDDLREIAAMSDEDVAQMLRDAGGDPAAIGERGARLAADLLARRERAERRPRLTRQEMIGRINAARRTFAVAIAAALPKDAAAASDEELAALIDELDALQAARDK